MHHSLAGLNSRLGEIGSRLILRHGPTLPSLRDLLRETGATALFWNRRYEPAITARDQQIKQTLRSEGVSVESFNGALLHEPWTIANQSGKPFQVFTPFWRHCLKLSDPSRPLARPRQIPAPGQWPESLPLAALDLEPRIAWASAFPQEWEPGEAGAGKHLQRFLGEALATYADDRDRPDRRGTSRLSPHLHFGEITPRQVWHAVREQAERQGIGTEVWRGGRYLTEVGWREFAHHLLYHYPETAEKPLRPDFARFPWRTDPELLRAWQKGRTGYPIVDAGMRELWATGWMHNRVRMIAGSFLVKDLLLPWTEGTRWFWDTLVDADLAQNTLGWQWTAGCGADAAPFFRIFNPITQGEKFDPVGVYVRRWCPELAALPDEWIHHPWEAPDEVLARARVKLGQSYPAPVVDHSKARGIALETFSKIRREIG